MKLAALTSAAVICALALAPAAFAQAAKATAKKDAVPAAAPAPLPPPSPELIRARMRPPVKGTAYIEVIKGERAKVVAGELRNTHKVKNTSASPIVGLRIDEYFYIGQKEVAVGSGKMRTALAPGEVAEITTAAEPKVGITSTQLMFTHANGQVKPTVVKKFTEDKK